MIKRYELECDSNNECSEIVQRDNGEFVKFADIEHFLKKDVSFEEAISRGVMSEKEARKQLETLEAPCLSEKTVYIVHGPNEYDEFFDDFFAIYELESKALEEAERLNKPRREHTQKCREEDPDTWKNVNSADPYVVRPFVMNAPYIPN